MITLLDLCKNQNIKLVLKIRDLCQLLSVLTESRLPPTYAYTLATITKILAQFTRVSLAEGEAYLTNGGSYNLVFWVGNSGH